VDVSDTTESVDFVDYFQFSISDSPSGIGESNDKEPAFEIQDQIDKVESDHLDQIIAQTKELGDWVHTKVLHGTPFIEIIRQVIRNDHDLVMINAEDRRGLKNVFFGTTSMHLMRKCPCPVWVVNPDQPAHLSNIMAAVDPNPVDEELNLINIKIMDLATSLAKREGSELVVVNTWIFNLESHARSGYIRIPPKMLNEWIENYKRKHKKVLLKLLEHYQLNELKHLVYMLKGEPEKLIPSLAKAKNIELIVMGTVSRTGIAGLLIGNTAEKILRQVNCSVLTVKPDGFISPVNVSAE